MDGFEFHYFLYFILVDLYDIFIFLFFLLSSHYNCSRVGLSLINTWFRSVFDRVQKIEPVEEIWVFLQSMSVLEETDYLVTIKVYLFEKFIDLLTVDPHMTIYQTAPMRDDISEVVLKLLKADVAISVLVHKGETELTLFVFLSVAEHVHNGTKLAEVKIIFPLGIKYFKHAVSKEGVTLLA